MTAAQGTPNRGKRGKSINLIKFDIFWGFQLKWTWGILDRLKMLPLSPLRFSTIGKPILRTFEILNIFRFFDNSSRTRAKARAKATARAMARATARARRTRARAKDRARARDGRTDGRTAGRSYLFSEMRSPVSFQNKGYSLS